jgi:epoxyqueuosine reductase QueG
MEACPTQAITAPQQLDARRLPVVSHHRKQGADPGGISAPRSETAFTGCDECLEVCPVNRFARQSRESTFAAREYSTAGAARLSSPSNDAAFRAPLPRFTDQAHQAAAAFCGMSAWASAMSARATTSGSERAAPGRRDRCDCGALRDWAIAQISARRP